MIYDLLALIGIACLAIGLALFDPRAALVGVGIALFVLALTGATNSARRPPPAPEQASPPAARRETRLWPVQ